jgi:hypothetical protein
MLFRPIRALGRAGNAFACENCGKALQPKRGSRRQRFCCEACKKKALRSRKWVARYDGLGPSRSVQNNVNNSKTCNGHFGDRPPDISGPPTVITQELIRHLDWVPVTSPDGVTVLVARFVGGRLL